MEIRITDGERESFTRIYKRDPLGPNGWVMERVRHGLEVLGCQLEPGFELDAVAEGETIEATARNGTRRVVVEVKRRRHESTSIFGVTVRWS